MSNLQTYNVSIKTSLLPIAMEVNKQTALLPSLGSGMDGAAESKNAAESKIATEPFTALTIPRATTEARSLASTVSRDTTVNPQMPKSPIEEGVGNKSCAHHMSCDAPGVKTTPCELPDIQRSSEPGEQAAQLVDATQQHLCHSRSEQHRRVLTVSPTGVFTPTKPSSVEELDGAESPKTDSETVPTTIGCSSATEKKLDPAASPKGRPKKKKKNHHKKQHKLVSDNHHVADAMAPCEASRTSGKFKMATKKLGASSVDKASCAANAETTKMDGTFLGKSQGALDLSGELDAPVGDLNGHELLVVDKPTSGMVALGSASVTGKKGRSLPSKRRLGQRLAGASWDQKSPEDAGKVKTGLLKNRFCQALYEPEGEPQLPVLHNEADLSGRPDLGTRKVTHRQTRGENLSTSQTRMYHSPLGKIEENPIPQTPGTSRTSNEKPQPRINGRNVQPQGKSTMVKSFVTSGNNMNEGLLTPNILQATSTGDVKSILIPKSRYKFQRVPILAKENHTQDEAEDSPEEPCSHDRAYVSGLDPDANKDAVKPQIDATTGKLLSQKDNNNSNGTSRGKVTRSQKNRLKQQRKKEQARVAAHSNLGAPLQSGLAQAQPKYSPQPQDSSETITITKLDRHLIMNQDLSSTKHQPVSQIGQIQDLLRSMPSGNRGTSRGSWGGRSRGYGSAQGRASASGDTPNTGSSQLRSFGHQNVPVERRQRGFQPQGMSGLVHNVTTNPPNSVPQHRQYIAPTVDTSSAVAVSSSGSQIATMNASILEAAPEHIALAPYASTNQSPNKLNNMPTVNSTPRPKSSVRRSVTSTTLVSSPLAENSDWDTPSASPEHLDWSKSINPNKISYNNLPKYNFQPTFSSHRHRNSAVHPQPILSELPVESVGSAAEGFGTQPKLTGKPTLKENENPSIRPQKAEPQGINISQRRYDENGAFIPPHLRPLSPQKQLVDVLAHDTALTASDQFDEEDRHLAPHLRRPVPKFKPAQATLVSSEVAGMPQGILLDLNDHPGTQTQHNISTKSGQECVATPSNLIQGHQDATATQKAIAKKCETSPVEPVHHAVPERAGVRSKAFGNVKPSRKLWEKDSNACGSASIDSNAAVNDGEMRVKTTLQYEPQLYDWEGQWAPAPVEWDARPAFDNRDARHMEFMEGWLDERAKTAVDEPIKINTQDPSFLDGDMPAGGFAQLDSRIEDEVFKTILPDDPFTHERIHQTAKDSARAYHRKAFREKKDIKQDRQSFKAAVRLHNESYVPPPNPHVPKANIYIRPAVASDMRQITQIYNHYITNSVVASERDALTEAQWRVRWQDATGENFAFLVAVLKNANRGGRFRRDNAETVVGFAYAEDFSESRNMYRFTCELQFWVHHQHLRHGIGKTLVDRMIGALDNGYYSRQGTDFVADNPIEYEGGGLRTIARILISIPHEAEDAKDLNWQTKWLSQWKFEQVGNLAGIGRKFDKDIDVAHLMKITSVIIPKGS